MAKHQDHQQSNSIPRDFSDFEKLWDNGAASAYDYDESFLMAGDDRLDGTGDEESVPFEQFELISAYLDDEVTDAERRTVNQWLAEDPKVRALYEDLGGLSQSLNQAPVPLSSSPEEIFAGVMADVKGKQTHRRRVFGGAAIAAGLAAIVGSVAVGIRQPGFQLAQNSSAPLASEMDGDLDLTQSPTPLTEPAGAALDDEPILERALILE